MNYTGEEEDPGIIKSFGGVVGSAFSRASEIVYGAKDKYEEYEVGSKLKTTGQVTVNILKSTGSALHSIATSDTTKHIIGKTGENIGYLFNRLFYGANSTSSPSNTTSSNNNNDDDLKEDDNNDGFISSKSGGDDYYNQNKKIFSKYSPPRNNSGGNKDDELSGTVLFKKDNIRYSSKSNMNY